MRPLWRRLVAPPAERGARGRRRRRRPAAAHACVWTGEGECQARTPHRSPGSRWATAAGCSRSSASGRPRRGRLARAGLRRARARGGRRARTGPVAAAAGRPRRRLGARRRDVCALGRRRTAVLAAAAPRRARARRAAGPGSPRSTPPPRCTSRRSARSYALRAAAGPPRARTASSRPPRPRGSRPRPSADHGHVGPARDAPLARAAAAWAARRRSTSAAAFAPRRVMCVDVDVVLSVAVGVDVRVLGRRRAAAARAAPPPPPTAGSLDRRRGSSPRLPAPPSAAVDPRVVRCGRKSRAPPAEACAAPSASDRATARPRRLDQEQPEPPLAGGAAEPAGDASAASAPGLAA